MAYAWAFGVLSARRWCWLKERSARELDSALADVWRARRLALRGLPLARVRWLPGRAALAAAGVLALEEVLGADPTELAAYGLSRATADALIRLSEVHVTQFQSGPNAGQVYDEDAVTLMASAARTESATSDTYELGDRGTLRLALDVTAITGTAKALHVQVETREAVDSGDWRVLDAFPVATATGTTYLTVPGCDAFVRAVATFAGTSATYSVAGTAV